LDFGHFGFAMPKARLTPTVQVLDFGQSIDALHIAS
jgi:hypothetical protein